MKSHRSILGFTLIELLVTTSIMGLLLSGAIVAFISFRNRQSVLGDAKLVQQYLYTAQTKARVGDKPATCTRLDGYLVTATAGAQEFQMQAVCDSGNVSISTLALSSEVTIQDAVSVQFLGLRGGAVGASTVTLVGHDLIYEFEITDSGTINEGEFGE